MRKPKGNPKMASSSSDTSLDVGSSSGSDSVPVSCASLAAAHVVKTRSKHSGPEAVADLLLQEYVNGVLRKLCTEAIGELVDDHFFEREQEYYIDIQ